MPAMLESLETRRLLASPAALDVTFGEDGRAIQPFADGRLLGRQPDGKILIRRVHHPGGGNALMRLNANGTLDSSFLGGAIRDFPIGIHRVSRSDGRILYVTPDAALHHSKISLLRADGTYDTSFGSGDGVVNLFDIDPGISIADVEWQGDKLLYLSGNRIHRLNADGSLDQSFGTAGAAEFTGFNDFQVDAAGRIYFVHDVQTQDQSGFVYTSRTTAEVVRLTPDGASDVTYDQNGVAIASTATTTQVDIPAPTPDTSMWRVESDGTVYHVMAQGLNAPADGPSSVLLARLTPGGDLSTRREFITSEGMFERLRSAISMGAQADGSLLIFGRDSGWQVTRLNADLLPDITYGENGTATFDLEVRFDRPILLPDDKLLIGGTRIGVAAPAFEVDRFLPSGQFVDAPAVTLNARGALVATMSVDSHATSLSIRKRDGRLVLRVGTFAQSFAPTKVKRLALFLGGGNDTLNIGAGVKGVYCDGGDGADTLNGGQGGDRIFGNDGEDTILGKGGNDYLLGGAGKDDLFGNGGTDTLSGAGGNDRLFGGPNDSDWINGGAGIDSAAADDKDHFGGVETFLA